MNEELKQDNGQGSEIKMSMPQMQGMLTQLQQELARANKQIKMMDLQNLFARLEFLNKLLTNAKFFSDDDIKRVTTEIMDLMYPEEAEEDENLNKE